MNIDSLRQKSAKLKHDVQTRYWPKLVVELESKSLRSLFFWALLLGLVVSVPWQCSRMVYNAYFTKAAVQEQEEGSPLASPKQNTGSITKMPNPRARRAATASIAEQPAEIGQNPMEQNPVTGETVPVPVQDQEAKAIHQEAPKYPIEALRNNESGTVQLRVSVDKDGMPADVAIENSSGSRNLDRAARAAVSQWRFSPKYENGAPVASELLIPIEFKADQ